MRALAPAPYLTGAECSTKGLLTPISYPWSDLERNHRCIACVYLLEPTVRGGISYKLSNEPVDHIGAEPKASGLPQWAASITANWLNDPSCQVVFAHYGTITPGVLEGLLAKAESASLEVGDGVALRKRLFNVLVEGLENMHRHIDADLADSCCAFLVDKGDGYRLFLGNALPVAAAALLVHRVSVLNEMDEVDLKEHFLKLLANDGRTDRGGAGLGLITMARKSAKPMLVRSIRRDANTAYMALELAVLRS